MASALVASDPEIAAWIQKELTRQRQTIELIASENFTSPAVMAAMGTVLTNKYAEGYPGARYYGGCAFIDEIESICRERAMTLFSAEAANVQPHSGAQANMAAYAAMISPGDSVLGLKLASGGHLTHGSPVNFSGKWYRFTGYDLRAEDETIDYDALHLKAREVRPKLIVAGASAYPRTIDFGRLRAIADDVDARLMVDMAHIAGLIAAELHPTPVGLADVVTSTTHKTLRGPRGGFILPRQELAAAVNKAVFPGIQGGPLEHVIAAKAVAFKEALTPEFRLYQRQVVENAKALASGLSALGYRLVAGGTDTHLLLVTFVGEEMTGQEAERRLDQIGITVNKNAVPNDPRPPRVTSGLRIGTPAVTTRGFSAKDMTRVAELIDEALKGADDEPSLKRLRRGVAELCDAHPLYPGLDAI